MKSKARPVRRQTLKRVSVSIGKELKRQIGARAQKADSLTSYQDDSISIKKKVYRAGGISFNEPGVGFVCTATTLIDVTVRKTGVDSAAVYNEDEEHLQISKIRKVTPLQSYFITPFTKTHIGFN